VWHIPALYQGATFDSDLVHALQHTSFLLAGFTFWMSLFGPLPKPAWFGAAAGAGFVAAVRLIGAVLANVLMWSGSTIYSRYGPSQAERGVDPLSDQGIAGVVMMAESTVITLSVLLYLVLRWASHDTERQELLDLAEARGVDLDPQRAERAVSAGQGGRLRERIESS
jgi:putative membrane protein